MAITLTIDDVDRTDYVIVEERPTFSLRLGARGDSQFTLKVLEVDSYAPEVGQGIGWFDGPRVFNGSIQSVEKLAPGPTGYFKYKVRAVSLEAHLDKRFCRRSFAGGSPAMSAGDIIRDILGEEGAGEGIIEGTIEDGAQVELLNCDPQRRISDIFDELAQKSDFIWYVNPEGELMFHVRTAFISSTVFEGALIKKAGVSLLADRRDRRNRQSVRISEELLPTEKDLFIGDGIQTTFVLKRNIRDIVSIRRYIPSGSPLTAGAISSQTGSFTGNLADGETITVGLQVYLFRTTINNLESQNVLIGATAAATAENFVRAVNDNQTGKGVSYSWPTTSNIQINLSRSGTDVTATAKLVGLDGDSYIVVDDAANFNWDFAALQGGVDTEFQEETFGVTGSLDVQWTFESGFDRIEQVVESPSNVLQSDEILVVEYKPTNYDVITVEDTPNVTAVAALEGRSGIYENFTERSEITDYGTAIDFAVGLITAFVDDIQEFQFSTYEPGESPGRIIKVTTTRYGFTQEQFLIETMDAEFHGVNPYQDHFRYTFNGIVGTRLQDWLKVFEKGQGGGGGGSGGVIASSSRVADEVHGYSLEGLISLTTTLALVRTPPVTFKNSGNVVHVSVATRLAASVNIEFDVRRADGSSLLSSPLLILAAGATGPEAAVNLDYDTAIVGGDNGTRLFLYARYTASAIGSQRATDINVQVGIRRS